MRDLVVLGRAGEGPGRLESLLRAEGPDGVILHDALRIEPANDDAYVALAPGHRAVGTLAGLGVGAGESLEASRGRRRLAGGSLAAGGWLLRATAAGAADVVAQLAGRARFGPADSAR